MEAFSSVIQANLFETPSEKIQRAHDACPEWLSTYALDTILELAESQEYLTADDVNQRMGEHNVTMTHPNAMGGIFRKASKLGYIRSAGFAVSERKERNGSIMRNWESCLYKKSI